jgi:hypothetical protein
MTMEEEMFKALNDCETGDLIGSVEKLRKKHDLIGTPEKNRQFFKIYFKWCDSEPRKRKRDKNE